jgi:hypothetical protein
LINPQLNWGESYRFDRDDGVCNFFSRSKMKRINSVSSSVGVDLFLKAIIKYLAMNDNLWLLAIPEVIRKEEMELTF